MEGVDQLYAQHIRSLPASSRLRLLALIAEDLAELETPRIGRRRSLLELEGLGEEIWQGVDAQTYVDGLRREWDGRP